MPCPPRPGRRQGNKETLGPPWRAQHLGTQREVYAAPWAAGEPVSLAMRTPAMLGEAENPRPLPAGDGEGGGRGRKKKETKPFLSL